MRQITIDGKLIDGDGTAYVVAEIGHNHGGRLKTALEMCKAAKDCGCDAVKFQKRTIDKLYTKAYLATPYNSVHSFGATYGEHRRALEFGFPEYFEIKAFCQHIGITMFATAWDEEAADFLSALGVPAFKVASADVLNIPLLRHIAAKHKPVIMSTGGASWEDIDRALDAMVGTEVALLHCVARYPTQAVHANLLAIPSMLDRYDKVIGYSCHYNGTLMATSAYLFGARIIEKHFTLDHTSKGSDHALSLQPDGMRKLVRDLGRLWVCAGEGDKVRDLEETLALQKMCKGMWPVTTLPAGTVITPSEIIRRTPLVSGGTEPWQEDAVVGGVIVHEQSTAVPFTGETLMYEVDK